LKLNEIIDGTLYFWTHNTQLQIMNMHQMIMLLIILLGGAGTKPQIWVLIMIP
jgi:hypothetical protein